MSSCKRKCFREIIKRRRRNFLFNSHLQACREEANLAMQNREPKIIGVGITQSDFLIKLFQLRWSLRKCEILLMIIRFLI